MGPRPAGTTLGIILSAETSANVRLLAASLVRLSVATSNGRKRTMLSSL